MRSSLERKLGVLLYDLLNPHAGPYEPPTAHNEAVGDSNMVTIDGTGLHVTVGDFELRFQRGDIGTRYGKRSVFVIWGEGPRSGGIFVTGRDWEWSRNWLGYVEANDSRRGSRGCQEGPSSPVKLTPLLIVADCL